jgi:hypothetical protein
MSRKQDAACDALIALRRHRKRSREESENSKLREQLRLAQCQATHYQKKTRECLIYISYLTQIIDQIGQMTRKKDP